MVHTHDPREVFVGLAQSTGFGLAKFGVTYSHSFTCCSSKFGGRNLTWWGSSQTTEPPIVVADTFAKVSQIAQEAVMDATQ